MHEANQKEKKFRVRHISQCSPTISDSFLSCLSGEYAFDLTSVLFSWLVEELEPSEILPAAVPCGHDFNGLQGEGNIRRIQPVHR